MDDDEFETLKSEKIKSVSAVSMEIETIAIDDECSFIDAVCIYAEIYDLTIEDMPKLLSEGLKQKIELEAGEKGLLKGDIDDNCIEFK